MIKSQKLSNHLLLFCQYLRDAEFLIGPKEMSESLRALEFIDITDLQQFRLTLKIVLCSSKEEQEKFDQAFKAFFLTANDKKDKDMLHFLSDEKGKDDLLRNDSSNAESEMTRETSEKENDEEYEAYQTVEAVKDNVVFEEFGEERSKVALWTILILIKNHRK